MRKIISKNPLYFAFLFPATVDGVITLLGQEQNYWTSRMVNEASPAYYFLYTSPLLYILGAIFWFIGWYFIFKKLKEPINLFIALTFIAGHSWGSTSWIWNIAKRNGFYTLGDQISIMLVWSVAIIYFSLISAIATYCIRVYFKTK